MGIPRYSDRVAGANMSDSAIPLTTSPSMTVPSRPASSRACFDSDAYCSMVNIAGRVGLRSGGSSTRPTTAASPLNPAMCRSPSAALGQADRGRSGHQDLVLSLLALDGEFDERTAVLLALAGDRPL